MWWVVPELLPIEYKWAQRYLKWPLMTFEVKLTQQNIFLNPIWVYMQKIVALGLDVKELPYFEVFDL